MEPEDIIIGLIDKNENAACAFAGMIAAESRESDRWYRYFDSVAGLLGYPNSYVRNRVMLIMAENARWDKDGLFDAYLEAYISRLADESPITVRQCIKHIPLICQAKPEYRGIFINRLCNTDTSRYKDSMRPLIEKDIRAVLKEIEN